MKKIFLLICLLTGMVWIQLSFAQQDTISTAPDQPVVSQSRWHAGDIIYYKEIQETVPSPEKGDFLVETKKEDATYRGEVRSVSDEGVVSVSIYKWANGKKGRLVATRKYNDMLMLRGTQTDFYPSGKVKRICVYSQSSNCISVVENDTLGNIVKKVEGRGEARKEWQYYNNGQVRKEKFGPGPKYTIHCYTKEGKETAYLEGDLHVFDDGVYVISGGTPYYPGGRDSIQAYLDRNVEVPFNLRPGYYDGMYSVRIADNGSVEDIRLVQSCGNSELDAEVMRVIKAMPKWEPNKLKKWKYVQNPKDAKVTVIRKRLIVSYSIIK